MKRDTCEKLFTVHSDHPQKQHLRRGVPFGKKMLLTSVITIGNGEFACCLHYLQATQEM